MKLILILIILTSLTTSCEIGCLKCGFQNNCLICDNFLNYILIDNNCKKIEIQNCVKINAQGNCFQCIQDYRIDKITGKCVLVEKELIRHCKYYDEEENCIFCKMDYYLSEGECLLVEIFVNNCAIYLSKNLCQICEDGYILTYDGKFCIEQPSLQNCQYWGFTSCTKCKDGYFENPNYYLKKYADSKIDSLNRLITKMEDYLQERTKLVENPICEEIKLKNCILTESHKKCKKCMDGYFLTEESICQKFPSPAINFCSEYLDEFTCINCEVNFYLRENNCIKNEEISHCLNYDSTKENTTCLKCQDIFFLSNNNCFERKNQKIDKCKEFNLFKDECLSCSEGYALDKNKIVCLKKIDNCLIQLIDENENKLLDVCKLCEEGFTFLNSCQPGEIPNCKYYSDQKCQECKNGFYLESSDKCETHNKIQNCEIYDGININQKNFCETCNKDSFKFKLNNKCKVNNNIPNCYKYNNINQNLICSDCFPGFYLENNTCLPSLDKNCFKNTSKDICKECNKGYVLNKIGEKNQCNLPHKYILKNCDEPTFSDDFFIDSLYCEYCKENHIPFNYLSGFVCINYNYTEFLGISDNKLVENCLKYNSHFKCILCQDKYFLYEKNEQTTCNSDCYGKKTKISLKLKLIDNKFDFEFFNKCIEDVDDTNCSLLAPLVFENYIDKGPLFNNIINDNNICISCSASFIPIINLNEIKNSNFNLSNQIENPYERFPQVECHSDSKLVSYQNSENCQYYISLGNEMFGCIKCKLGYHGKVIKKNDAYYIEKCEPMSECNIRTFYNSYDIYNKIFSCYKCNSSNNIPFVALGINANSFFEIKGLKSYNLTNADFGTFEEGEEDFGIKCLDPENSSHFANIPKIENFPENCGLGVIDVDYNIDSNIRDHIFCVACKPGYQPDSSYPSKITKCTKIVNCLSENQIYFNSCTQCEKNYVFEYIENPVDYNQITNNSCVQNFTPNCYAAIKDIPLKCVICSKGFQLNHDFICEKILAPYCEDEFSSVFFNIEVKHNTLNFLMYFFPRGKGCNKCKNEYFALEMVKTKYVCSSSSYLTEKKGYFETGSVYINKCTGYQQLNKELFCKRCEVGYLLDDKFKSCQKRLKNCLYISSENKDHCFECKENFSLINFECVQGEIKNCKRYNEKINKSQIECERCEDKYYLTNMRTECKIGTIKYCKVYSLLEEGKKCEQCEEGFIHLKGKKDICYKLDESLMCKSAVYINGIECEQCDNFNQMIFPLEENDNKNICMEYNKIDNCLLYDINDNITETLFECKECREGFFLKDLECFERKKIIENCNKYKLDEDECEKCSFRYFLNKEKICEENPRGILGCRTYLDKNTCEFCEKEMYLKNNTCFQIESNDLKENCIFYDNDLLCLICKDGYFLKDRICLEKKIKNCEVYQTENLCLKCTEGNILIKYEFSNSCEPFLIENCLLIDQYNHVCNECKYGFYLNETGNCSLPINPINFCEKYNKDQKCEKCNFGKILNYKKTFCESPDFIIDKLDENCYQNIFEQKPRCSECLSGYNFYDNRCVKMEKDLYIGCFITFLDDLNECYICESGFYQDINGSCISNSYITDIVNLSPLVSYLFLFSYLAWSFY